MFPGYAGFRFTLAAEQSFCQARPFCHYRGQLLVLRCSVALFWSLIQTWYFNLKDIWNILYLLWMNEIVVQTPFFFFFFKQFKIKEHSDSALPFSSYQFTLSILFQTYPITSDSNAFSTVLALLPAYQLYSN